MFFVQGLLGMSGPFGIGDGGPADVEKVIETYFPGGYVRQWEPHPSVKVQITVGIKTLIISDVFYLQGREVNRRRR
jgi:hypothetical protein